jgi:hypothetical protein
MGLGPPVLALYRQLKELFVDGELYDGKRIKYISKGKSGC